MSPLGNHLLVVGSSPKGSKRSKAKIQRHGYLHIVEPMEGKKLSYFLEQFQTAEQVALRAKEEIEMRKREL